MRFGLIDAMAEPVRAIEKDYGREDRYFCTVWLAYERKLLLIQLVRKLRNQQPLESATDAKLCKRKEFEERKMCGEDCILVYRIATWLVLEGPAPSTSPESSLTVVQDMWLLVNRMVAV